MRKFIDSSEDKLYTPIRRSSKTHFGESTAKVRGDGHGHAPLAEFALSDADKQHGYIGVETLHKQSDHHKKLRSGIAKKQARFAENDKVSW